VCSIQVYALLHNKHAWNWIFMAHCYKKYLLRTLLSSLTPNTESIYNKKSRNTPPQTLSSIQKYPSSMSLYICGFSLVCGSVVNFWDKKGSTDRKFYKNSVITFRKKLLWAFSNFLASPFYFKFLYSEIIPRSSIYSTPIKWMPLIKWIHRIPNSGVEHTCQPY
jgi:hypothetical protein